MSSFEELRIGLQLRALRQQYHPQVLARRQVSRYVLVAYAEEGPREPTTGLP